MEDGNKGRRNYGFPGFNRSDVAIAVSTIVFHPLHTIKVRMQLGQGPNKQLIAKMLRNEGIASFYKGLSAGLLRELIHNAVRVYSYKCLVRASIIADICLIRTSIIRVDDIRQYYSSLYYRWILCKMMSNIIGAIASNPAELASTRMQGDATLPLALRRNYKNMFHALYQTASKEGLPALWRGAGPNALGIMTLHFGTHASSAGLGILKQYVSPGNVMQSYGYISASFLFLAVPPVLSKPFDYVKIQLQMMQPDAKGRYPYTGALDCAKKTFKLGGPLKFFSGFVAYCFTLAPRNMLAYMLSERVFKGVDVSFRV